MNLAPVVLFVYNRIWHLRQTVEALRKNMLADKSELFIYSDAPRDDEDVQKVDKVRTYIKGITGFKKVNIIEREVNWGLSKSIIEGVSDIVNEYGKVIVLEDDMVTSPYFLTFMNRALSLYEKDDRVASVHGYVYPIEGLPSLFFLKGADCWGWGTWKRAWELFEQDGQRLYKTVIEKQCEHEIDLEGAYPYMQMLKDYLNGKNDSWAVRWYISMVLQNKLTLYPGKSLVNNIGLDGMGTHCGVSEHFKVDITSEIDLKKISVVENSFAREKIKTFLRKSSPSLVQRIRLKIRKYLV